MAEHKALESLYRDVILAHNRAPRNFHAMPEASHQARGFNALCGDDIHVYLKVGADQLIQAASFLGEASAITLASASMMTEQVVGLPVSEALLRGKQLAALLAGESCDRKQLGELLALEGVRAYPSRIKSAMLAWRALAAALTGRAVAKLD